jgi:fructose-bisphosphate aldolase class 1
MFREYFRNCTELFYGLLQVKRGFKAVSIKAPAVIVQSEGDLQLCAQLHALLTRYCGWRCSITKFENSCSEDTIQQSVDYTIEYTSIVLRIIDLFRKSKISESSDNLTLYS